MPCVQAPMPLASRGISAHGSGQHGVTTGELNSGRSLYHTDMCGYYQTSAMVFIHMHQRYRSQCTHPQSYALLQQRTSIQYVTVIGVDGS